MTQDRPQIVRLGTIDHYMVETTPLVFKDRLWLFQYVRHGYRDNHTEDSYFRFTDPDTGETTCPFGHGLHLGSAFLDGDRLYAFGVEKWGGQNLFMTQSADLCQWSKPVVAFHDPDMGAYNTSICQGRHGKYIMACEQDRPEEEVGIRFTVFFLESDNLTDWRRCPQAPPFSPERYTACPALRFVDDMYYLFVLEGSYETFFAEHLYRSPDLTAWQASPFNPCLAPHRLDRQVATDARISQEQRVKIQAALNINNSDLDLCEYRGNTEIFYDWGDQKGIEFLARARSPMPLATFLKGWFPASLHYS